MSNSIPHFVSDSPPPIANNDEEDYDDEFGDFTGPGDLSFDNDLSTPSTPKNSKHVVDNFSPFEINKIENKYEENIKIEAKATNNFIRNELPNKNYINILDHIESDALKIVNRDKEDILKENNSVKGEFKELSTEKELNESNLEENGENFSENIAHIESPKETENVNDGLPISYVVSTENSDIVNSSDECDLRKKTDINNFSEQPPEQLSAIVDDSYNSKYCFAEFSILSQDNINLKDDLDIDSKESIEANVSKQFICQKETLVVNLSSGANLSQYISKNEEIVKYENQTVNSTHVPVFEQENYDNGVELDSKAIHEISNGQVTSNHLSENNEGIYTCHTKNLLSSECDGAHQISHANLKESKIEESQHESLEANDNCEDDDFGEFADFKTSNLNGNNSVFNIQSEVENEEQTEDDFAEFGDFANSKHNNDFNESNSWQTFEEKTKIERIELKQDGVVSDELDDFADYTTFSKPSNDDDFDDFSDHSAFNRQNSANCDIPGIIKICKDPEEAFEHSQIVLKDMFEPDESGTEDYVNSDITLGNLVFESLKDITETNALMYQWEKSSAQKNILKTLNIDIRNILYGPTWNAGIPIFAANLCSTPLEPIKSEVICSPSPHKPKETLDVDRFKLSTDVPLAEFDWSGAGLTNPLDSFEIVDKELETSNIPNEISQESGNPLVASITPSEITQKQDQKDDISTYPLSYPNNVSICEDDEQVVENEEDFSDFTSYQPSFEKDTSWTGKMLPLRESHISYQPSSTKEESIIKANLKPSLESAISNFNLDLSFLESKFTSTEIPKVTASSKSEDFSDLELFSLKENKLTVEKPKSIFEDENFKAQSNYQQHYLQDTEIRPITSSVTSENIDVISTTQIISKIMETPNSKSNSLENTATEQCDQDEEFTDFHSSLPTEFNPSPASKVSFLEPLKPAVLQPVPVNPVAKIEWPEPGLDEDEVSRIVAGCLQRKSETETEVISKDRPAFVKENKDISKVTETQNYNSGNDDEEWSDFVSVKEHVKSRTATPDLPLSVFNLGNIQPVKAPTPVLTPNGLICSPVKNSLPNMSVPKSNINLQKNIQHHPQKHPFITSQAFDALYQYPTKNIGLVNNSFCDAPRQITNPSYTHCKDQNTNIFDTYFDTTTPNVSNIGYASQQNETSYGKFQSSYLSTTKNSEDDEEWGDFVSATSTIPPYNSNPNSMHTATRIITNPSHFMGAFNKNVSSDQYSSSNKSTMVRQERRNIPSISALPDLDFVSPRRRDTKK
ncbi:hypothetical protein WA026_002885 [Henosepilachna vigintioctopunctata]|uniref:Aftiphilin clathrin-binding box domain-containing protein n=1 Tax=Henosepilachna vigintioctopunctata TaxID=420089 RepID=A0AAW1TKX7_9CUCU